MYRLLATAATVAIEPPLRELIGRVVNEWLDSGTEAIPVELPTRQFQFYYRGTFDDFPYFNIQAYVVGIHYDRLAEVVLMNTHNVCLCGALKNIIPYYHQIPTI